MQEVFHNIFFLYRTSYSERNITTTDEMLEEFSYLGAQRAYEVVVKNPNMIADQIEHIEPVLSGSYPPSIPNSAEDLENMCREKARELYEEDGVLPKIVSDRVDAELIPIIKNGFDVMYMIAQKLVAKSNEMGYLVGSRGSVGSSFVACLSGITEDDLIGNKEKNRKRIH